MHLPKALRRLAASTVAVLFLACQSAAIAQACVTFAPQPESAAAPLPCHSSGDQDGAGGGSGQNNDCGSATASASGFSVYGLDGQPAITSHFDRIVAVAVLAAPAKPALLRIESPPRTILHCCRRN